MRWMITIDGGRFAAFMISACGPVRSKKRRTDSEEYSGVISCTSSLHHELVEVREVLRQLVVVDLEAGIQDADALDDATEPGDVTVEHDRPDHLLEHLAPRRG